jgi:hypothetical protein
MCIKGKRESDKVKGHPETATGKVLISRWKTRWKTMFDEIERIPLGESLVETEHDDLNMTVDEYKLLESCVKVFRRLKELSQQLST